MPVTGSLPSGVPSSGDPLGSATPSARLSIGALSRATGIPVETLRTWEARYGFPVPERKPSGHRVYPTTVVGRLRRVAEALARGHRASDVVAAGEAELSTLLETTPAHVLRAPLPGPIPETESSLDWLFEAVTHLDAERLRRLLLSDWARLGPIEFLERRVGPLVRTVGHRWADGTLEIRHEHFTSECVGDLLRVLRVPFEERAHGPTVAFSTLPGESHGLGLHMAALVVATARCRVVYLGTDTPLPEIVAFAREAEARAVAVSVSLATKGRETDTMLADLRDQIPRRVSLVVGGDGAPAPSAGVQVISTFAELYNWAERLQGA